MVWAVSLNPFSILRDSELLSGLRARLAQTKPMMLHEYVKGQKTNLGEDTAGGRTASIGHGRSRNAYSAKESSIGGMAFVEETTSCLWGR